MLKLNLNIQKETNQIKMKKKKNIPKENGIISIVQSPDRGENNTVDEDKLVTENEPDEQKEHGIISIVQSPEDGKNRENA